MNEKDLERKFSNLEAKLSQNRGYTTELKNKMISTNDILIGHMNGLEKNLLEFGKPVIRLLEMLYSYVWSVSDNKDAIEDMKKDVVELHKVIEKFDGKKECSMCIKEAMCEFDELSRKKCKQNNKMFFKVSSKMEKKEWLNELYKTIQYWKKKYEECKKQIEKKDCNECDLYGECDHQGAYQINGKWCYDDSVGEKEGDNGVEAGSDKKASEVVLKSDSKLTESNNEN